MRRRVEDGICEVDCFHAEDVVRARAGLPAEAALREIARGVKALGHPSRLRILHALDGRELCVCDLSHVLGLSVSGTSQHLRELRDLGAIDYRTEGKLVFYALTDRFWLELSERVAARLGHAKAGHAKPRKPVKKKRRA
jgi:DNA-binding transcriptional ArsR family regulator